MYGQNNVEGGSGSSLPPIVDLPDLLVRVGNDRDLLRDLCEIFIAELPGMLATLERAVQGGDATSINRTAHGLKGAVSVFGKGICFQKALQLEMAGRENQLGDATVIFAELVRCLETLKVALTQLMASSQIFGS